MNKRNKTNNYIVRYKDHVYRYNGRDTFEALNKFKRRKVFGRALINQARIDFYDAKTNGILWLRAIDNDWNVIHIDFT